MLTWVTVWVLTVIIDESYMHESRAATYQLSYYSQSMCEKQRKNHQGDDRTTRCNFQQVPVYKGK